MKTNNFYSIFTSKQNTLSIFQSLFTCIQNKQFEINREVLFDILLLKKKDQFRHQNKLN